MATVTPGPVTETRPAPHNPGRHPDHPEGILFGGHDLVSLGDKISTVVTGETPTPKGWYPVFLLGLGLLSGLGVALFYLFYATASASGGSTTRWPGASPS